ncbi:hypothetical protein H0H87_000821 [Tephrocybe sp. NHM501043]|nr:hypothetical protein H0H87_000821 [Tephrocybe sp. NHM501043]
MTSMLVIMVHPLGMVLLSLCIQTFAFDVEKALEPTSIAIQPPPTKPIPKACWASFFFSCTLIIKSIAAPLPPSTTTDEDGRMEVMDVPNDINNGGQGKAKEGKEPKEREHS